MYQRQNVCVRVYVYDVIRDHALCVPYYITGSHNVVWGLAQHLGQPAAYGVDKRHTSRVYVIDQYAHLH